MKFNKTGISSTGSSAPFCIFLILFGMVFAGFGGYVIYGNIKIILNGEKLKGVVVNYETKSSSDGNTYAPIVKFKYQGKTLQKEAKIYTSSRSFNIGERVAIYYDPGDPRKILIRGYFRIWGFGSIFLMTGLGVSSLGIFIWLKFKRLRYILEHGKIYPGKILSIIEKVGARRNDLGQLKNTFKVEFEWSPPGSGKTVVNKKNVFLPVFPQLHQAGDELLIFADPRNPKNFELDPGTSFPPTSRPQNIDHSYPEEAFFTRDRIKNFSPQGLTTAYGWGSVIFGLPFAGMGAYAMMAGAGIVEVDPSSVHAPFWVLTAIGSVFAVAGLFLMGYGLMSVAAKKRVMREKIKHPNNPWLWDYQWRRTGISEKREERYFSYSLQLPFLPSFSPLLTGGPSFQRTVTHW